MEAEVLQIRGALKAAETEHASLRAEADKVRAEMKDVDFAKDADAFKRVDEAYVASDAKRDEIAELRKREARLLEIVGDKADAPRPSTERDEARGLAQRYVDSDVYRSMIASGRLDRGRVGETDPVEIVSKRELQDGLRRRTTVDNTAGSGGGRIWSDRLESLLIEKPVRAIRLLDLITVGATDSDTIEWAKETTVTDAAVETAYGTAAPESAYGYTKELTTVKRIPHFVPATKGSLMDSGQLETLLENRLVRGVRLKLESEILNGDASGEDFTGLATVAGTLTQARATDTRFDATHKAITQVRLNYFEDPSVIGLHPTDFENILLEKDANGNYVHGRAASEGTIQSIWGLLPVVSSVFTQGTVWVGDFSQAYLWVRTGVNVSISDSHASFFIQGLVAILAEMRAAFAVVQPLAFCKVTGY